MFKQIPKQSIYLAVLSQGVCYKVGSYKVDALWQEVADIPTGHLVAMAGGNAVVLTAAQSSLLQCMGFEQTAQLPAHWVGVGAKGLGPASAVENKSTDRLQAVAVQVSPVHPALPSHMFHPVLQSWGRCKCKGFTSSY